MAINVPEVEQYIRQAAIRRGINPDIAVRVAKSEGLAPGVWQSTISGKRGREPSYGPYQLLVGGGGTGFPTGLGNDFIKETGLDPRDPSTVRQQVDFALDKAASGGWSPWYGAAKVGVNRWDGLQGAKSTGVAKGPDLSPEAMDFVRSNPQPGGYGPEVENTVFGSMAPTPPAPDPTMTASSGPGGFSPAAADFATSSDIKPGDRLAAFFTQLGKGMEAPALKPSAFPGGPSAAQMSALPNALSGMTAGDALLRRRFGMTTNG